MLRPLPGGSIDPGKFSVKAEHRDLMLIGIVNNNLIFMNRKGLHEYHVCSKGIIELKYRITISNKQPSMKGILPQSII